ncbi:Crp/Fnr family transcriptional regulator [Variovorax humicola]|uniref:Crp/Fnr family transcriptional regulator n=1 Tax=Variovorax humicola TaxID=1769758 RepID=A0ABU8WAY8_9BURK
MFGIELDRSAVGYHSGSSVKIEQATVPVETLCEFELFKELPAATLKGIACSLHLREIKAGEVLIYQADETATVYLLLEGRAASTVLAVNGRQILLREIEAGEVFGEFAPIDGNLRSSEVIALKHGSIATLSGNDFRNLMMTEPVLAECLLRRLVAKLRQLSDRVVELGALDVRARLSSELLRRVRATGVVENRGRIDPCPRQQALADQIGTSREQVSRSMTELAHRGVVIKKDKALIIPDVARLSYCK